MAVRKLFVSHSSKEPADLKRLRAACNALKQLGYYVLVDKNAEFDNKEAEIVPGSDWDLRITEWMAECHAAVILFNTTALEKSDWVKKEAAVLSWRRELEAGFTLIPVLLDNVEADDLQKGLYGVLRIAKGQCIRSSNDAATIVQGIRDGLGPPETMAHTPFERLEKILRRILQEQADVETLEEAWQALDGDSKPDWQSNQKARFADALTRFLLRDPTRALEQLKKLINAIRPRVTRDRADELVQSLACLWVDERSAAGLAGARHAKPPRGVALNGRFLAMFTAERYMERAWPLDDLRQLVSIDQQAFRTPEDAHKAIRDHFRPEQMPDQEPLNRLLDRQIAGLREPVVVLVVLGHDDAGHPQFPDPALLREASSSYPNLIFLFGTGDAIPPPESLPEGVRVLDPRLDLDLETTMWFELDQTWRFLRNFYKKPGASR